MTGIPQKWTVGGKVSVLPESGWPSVRLPPPCSAQKATRTRPHCWDIRKQGTLPSATAWLHLEVGTPGE